MVQNVVKNSWIPCFIIHCFVQLADDVILFAKSNESIQDLLHFRREIDSVIEMPFETSYQFMRQFLFRHSAQREGFLQL